MNTIKRLSPLMMVRRCFARKINPGVQGRLSLLKETDPDINLENIDEMENLEDLESDFMHVGDSYVQHQSEVKSAKEKLKMQITKRKYLKELEPSFLTFAEKEQIRSLHKDHPLEWTPETLSESFPALPQTVRKVIKAKWSPTSVNQVLGYDKAVIDNWDKFKRGELFVSSKLAEHLKKFIDRKIQLTDREKVAEKIVPPKFELPKPKSTLYSNIVKSYLNKDSVEQQTSNRRGKSKLLVATSVDESKDRNKQKDLSQSTTVSSNDLHDGREHGDSETVNSLMMLNNENNISNVSVRTTLNSQLPPKERNRRDFITVDDFMQQELEHATDKMSVERKVLIDISRKLIESDAVEGITSTSVPSQELNEVKADSVESTSAMDSVENSYNDDSAISKSEFKAVQISRREFPSDTPETYVKEWYKKDNEEDYPSQITIPKNKFKSGMTYRVKDRYYDDDGEFLYRVPGLKD